MFDIRAEHTWYFRRGNQLPVQISHGSGKISLGCHGTENHVMRTLWLKAWRVLARGVIFSEYSIKLTTEFSEERIKVVECNLLTDNSKQSPPWISIDKLLIDTCIRICIPNPNVKTLWAYYCAVYMTDWYYEWKYVMSMSFEEMLQRVSKTKVIWLASDLGTRLTRMYYHQICEVSGWNKH